MKYYNNNFYEKYNKILDKYINLKNIFLLDVNKYVKNNNYLINNHRNHFIQEVNINLWIELVEIIRNIYNKNITFTPIFFSEFFENYYLINDNNNIKVTQINEHLFDKRLLSLNLLFNSDKIHNRFGIYFSMPSYFIKKYNKYFPIQKYKFKLMCKITSNILNDNKIKIFTGIKWIEINLPLTNEYQIFELDEIFDFNKTRTYRLSFTNIYENMCVSIFNPILEDIN